MFTASKMANKIMSTNECLGLDHWLEFTVYPQICSSKNRTASIPQQVVSDRMWERKHFIESLELRGYEVKPITINGIQFYKVNVPDYHFE